jgi:hypothetical protein
LDAALPAAYISSIDPKVNYNLLFDECKEKSKACKDHPKRKTVPGALGPKPFCCFL